MQKEPIHSSQKPLSSSAQAENPLTIVALTYSKSSHRALETAATRQGWTLLWADSWRDALQAVESRRTGVVLLDRQLLGTDWRDALQLLLQPAHRCCVILLTIGGKDGFCEEFLADGGCQVLSTPLQEPEVIEAVHSAWTFWKQCIGRAYHYESG